MSFIVFIRYSFVIAYNTGTKPPLAPRLLCHLYGWRCWRISILGIFLAAGEP
jgi:hypothetical protein